MAETGENLLEVNVFILLMSVAAMGNKAVLWKRAF